MNWRKITKYAFALLVAQVAIGFVEGFFFVPSRVSTGVAVLLASASASFLACGAIFARLAADQPSKPFAHALAALALQAALASAPDWTMSAGTGREQLDLVMVEWLALLLALFVGTSVGSSHRRGTVQSAGA